MIAFLVAVAVVVIVGSIVAVVVLTQ